MTPELAAFLKALILPPGVNLFLIVIAWIFLKRHKTIATVLIVVSVSTLYIFSMPVVARSLAAMIEPTVALQVKSPEDTSGKAIIILGCGRYARPPEYPDDDISACALIRLRYAAEIIPKLQLPVLISGGRVFNGGQSEAEIMAHILETRFNIKSTWLEKHSRNTIENARNSAHILHENNIDTIYLVTHALHMQRSTLLFQHQGFKVIQAPTYFYSARGYSPAWLDYLPSAAALLTSNMVFKEYLGILWQTVIDS